MNPTAPIAAALMLLLGLTAAAQSPLEPIETPATMPVPSATDLGGSFTFRVCVRMSDAPEDLPLIFRVFVVSLVLLMWRREHGAAVSGAS